MNYSDMAAFVRAQADTDADDAPDATLRVYASAAYKDIRRRVFPWPDKKSTYQFTTVPGTAFYPYADMQAPDLEYVISVNLPTNALGYISPEQYEAHQGAGQTGDPAFFVPDVTGMWLFPQPNTAVTMTLTAYRKFLDWPQSNADEPDLSRTFDEVICWFMLAKYYTAQEDLELAQTYMQEYEVSLAHQIEGALRSSAITAGPRVFGNQSLYVGVLDAPVSRIVV